MGAILTNKEWTWRVVIVKPKEVETLIWLDLQHRVKEALKICWSDVLITQLWQSEKMIIGLFIIAKFIKILLKNVCFKLSWDL